MLKKSTIILTILLLLPMFAEARYNSRSVKRVSILQNVSSVSTNITNTSNVSAVTPTPVVVASQVPAVLSDGVVTNEYAYWNPSKTDAVKSSIWDMTSGSLFLKGGKYWTGSVDAGKPNALSSNFTNSAIFRLHTDAFDKKNVNVSFNLYPLKMTSTTITPEVAWDGVHVFLRYQSEFNLYYASVLRRDGIMVIKKKCPGGVSNGGTYYEISPTVKVATPTDINVSVRDQQDGSVLIQILDGSKVLLTGVDKGMGCPVITNPGAVGIRGDNTEFMFDSFNVVNI